MKKIKALIGLFKPGLVTFISFTQHRVKKGHLKAAVVT